MSGMEVPECVFCSNYTRYGSGSIVQPDDVHACLLHGVTLPWEGMQYVCTDFRFKGGVKWKPGGIKAPNYMHPGLLYRYPPAYERATPVAMLADLPPAPHRADVEANLARVRERGPSGIVEWILHWIDRIRRGR